MAPIELPPSRFREARTLTVTAGPSPARLAIAGAPVEVCRVVIGCQDIHAVAVPQLVLDDYFERGGNAFDTAVLYMNGLSDAILGDWMASRGVRSDCFVIEKVAHRPRCRPEAVAKDLARCLENLQTERVDLLLLHQDDTDVPVKEWVDALAAAQAAGRCSAYGVSNWRASRCQAANAYAASHGLPALAAVSNQLSLARLIDPPCPHQEGTPAALRTWLASTGTPLLAWSARAMRFFAAEPASGMSRRLAHAFYDDANVTRLARAAQLAETKGVAREAVALVWLFAQPFPTAAIVGCRTPADWRAVAQAVQAVSVTRAEADWLDLEV